MASFMGGAPGLVMLTGGLSSINFSLPPQILIYTDLQKYSTCIFKLFITVMKSHGLEDKEMVMILKPQMEMVLALFHLPRDP